MSLHTMPLNVGDFLRDTQELSDAEGGSYIFLLIALWGSKDVRLPADAATLRRIARCGPKRWTATWKKLEPYFAIEGDWLTQKRVTFVRQKVAEKVQKRRAAGKKGGDANALRHKEIEEANASANASAKSKQVPNQSKSNSPIGENSEAKASEAAPRETAWSIGKPMLEKAGMSSKEAGAAIGMLVKRKGEVQALAIVVGMRASPPMNPGEYIFGVIHGKQAPASDPGAAPDLELVMVDGKPTYRPVAKRKVAA